MSGAARIALFVVGLVGVFGGGLALGKALDPGDDGRAADAQAAHGGEDHGRGAEHAPASEGPLRLVLDDDRLAPGREERFAFQIRDASDRPVDAFEVEHERRMHFIAVRRDLTGFQHLHPKRTGDGGWEVPLTLDEPGEYRVFADFKHAGKAQTLGADVSVAGDYRPRDLPAPSATAAAGEGYEVRLSKQADELRFTVGRDGRRLDDIEPYLGARGHLVALRDGDLRYLHVHPKDEATEGRDIRFGVTYPSRGRYRLFLQFKHDGRVRTAAFTQQTEADEEAAHGHGDDHAH